MLPQDDGVAIMDDDLGLLEPGSAAIPSSDDDRRPTIPSLRQSRLLVLVAAVMWSTSGFFVKSPYLAGWSGERLAFWRAAFACLALWPMVRRPVWSWKLIPMTLLFVGMNYSYLTTMTQG